VPLLDGVGVGLALPVGGVLTAGTEAPVEVAGVGAEAGVGCPGPVQPVSTSPKPMIASRAFTVVLLASR
jgi:hypothetical protein